MENRAKPSQKRNEPFMVRALITATDGQAQLDSAHLILFQKAATKQAGATSRSGEMPGAQGDRACRFRSSHAPTFFKNLVIAVFRSVQKREMIIIAIKELGRLL